MNPTSAIFIHSKSAKDKSNPIPYGIGEKVRGVFPKMFGDRGKRARL
jgi:hypothetical protein